MLLGPRIPHPWLYRGEPFVSKDIKGHKAFLYVIEFNIFKQRRCYIGFKRFGAKSTGDWKDYVGSSKKTTSLAWKIWRTQEEGDKKYSWDQLSRFILGIYKNPKDAQRDESRLLYYTQSGMNPYFLNQLREDIMKDVRKTYTPEIPWEEQVEIFRKFYADPMPFDIEKCIEHLKDTGVAH